MTAEQTFRVKIRAFGKLRGETPFNWWLFPAYLSSSDALAELKLSNHQEYHSNATGVNKLTRSGDRYTWVIR